MQIQKQNKDTGLKKTQNKTGSSEHRVNFNIKTWRARTVIILIIMKLRSIVTDTAEGSVLSS